LTELIHSQSDVGDACPVNFHSVNLRSFAQGGFIAGWPVHRGNRDNFSLADFRVLIRTFSAVRCWFRFAGLV